MEIVFWSILIPLVSILFVSVYNLFTAPALKIKKYSGDERVSILVPARNEERNIGKCIKYILAQSYSNFELLILDDGSTDNTAGIIKEYEKSDPRVRYIKGAALPEGWLGKNWACHQLSEKASGGIFVFMDADVELAPFALETVLAEYNEYKPGMLSVFPTQLLKTAGEWLVVPLMNWILTAFLPLKKVYTSRNRSFCAANGQFILFSRDEYIMSGGHYAVKHNVVEDMELCRREKMLGKKVYTLLGSDVVKCRMYGNFGEAVFGFSKNFYPGFNTNPLIFISTVFIISVLFLIPILFFKYLWLHLIIIAIIRVITSLLSRQNLLINLFLHTFQMPVLAVTGIISVISTHRRKRRWKERTF